MTDQIYISNIYYILNNIDSNDNFFVYKKINHRKLMHITLSEFLIWIEDFLEIEKEYIKLYNFHGFRIIFHNNSSPINENFIYPIYPWKKILVDALIKNKKEISNYRNIDYKYKYLKLVNTILKNERIWYRNLSRRRKK